MGRAADGDRRAKTAEGKWNTNMAVGQNQWYHFGLGLFQWGLGCSLGVWAFDPYPHGLIFLSEFYGDVQVRGTINKFLVVCLSEQLFDVRVNCAV